MFHRHIHECILEANFWDLGISETYLPVSVKIHQNTSSTVKQHVVEAYPSTVHIQTPRKLEQCCNWH